MLQVIRGWICKDTVALCKWILEQALLGNVRGLAVCIRLTNARDKVVFTGAYKARPENAVSAAAWMYCIASNQAEFNPRGKQ